MKKDTVEVRNGLKFTCDVPESAAEYDKLAPKGVGTCVSDAVDNIWYRSLLPRAWKGLAAKLLELHKIPLKTKPRNDGKKDAKGNPIMVAAESPVQYVDRVAAEKKVDPTTFQSLVDQFVAPTLKFDLTVREAQPREAGAGKANLALARTYLADPKALARVTKNIEKLTGTKVVLTGTPEENEKALALGIKAFIAAQTNALTA